MENEEDYARVVPTSGGNNGGNKIKLWAGDRGKNRARVCARKREEGRARVDHFRPG